MVTKKLTKGHNTSKTRKFKRDKKWFIGTSGFMISQKNWLSIPNLNCIEINSTFYKLPSVKSIEKWHAFPSHVSFSIKASKYITHIKRLKNVKEEWRVFWDRISPLGDKLKVVLLQPKTSDITYLRIHGGRGYRGELSKKELRNLKKNIRNKKAKENYIMFNNTFFNKYGKSCKINDIKVIYAAVCNAVEFTKITG